MFQPNPPPRNIEELTRYLFEELNRAASAINQPQVDYVQFTPLTAAPDKPRAGRVYLADAANWDPLTTSASNAYFVWYTGTAYRGLHETANGTNLT